MTNTGYFEVNFERLKQPYKTVEQSQITQKKPTNGVLDCSMLGFSKIWHGGYIISMKF